MRRVPIRGPFVCAVAVVLLLPCAARAHENGGQHDTSPETIYHVGDAGVRAPRGVSMPEPEYSDHARRKKISGSVLVGMLVEPDGTVRDVKVTKSLEKSLDQQAIAAVRKWKFEPGTKDGQPVAVHVDAEVTFRIR
jgi:protein TonB